MSDVITVVSDDVGVAYYSNVWGQLSQLEYINYLNNIRNGGIVFKINPSVKYGNIVKFTIYVY